MRSAKPSADRKRAIKYGLKLLEIEERAFRKGNGHANGHGHEEDRAPIVARFLRSPDAPVVEQPAEPEPEAGGRANGQEYVAG